MTEGTVRLTGLSRLQRLTLDERYGPGWTVAAWTSPTRPLDPSDRLLGGGDDGVACFGGVHLVVNGEHVVVSRRGRWIGRIAWGGRQIPVDGERRPWHALVATDGDAGPHGGHRIPRKGSVVRARGLRVPASWYAGAA